MKRSPSHRLQFEYCDHRGDPEGWAKVLGISTEAVALYLSCDVVDLHVDSFIWHRIWGHDVRQRRGPGLFRGRFWGQCDLPRAREAQLAGAMWSITTSPFRGRGGRLRAFKRNLSTLKSVLESVPEEVTLVRNWREFRAARALGRHAAMIAVQGGNALDASPAALDALVDDLVLRVTLVHLSNSVLGDTSAPWRLRAERGLTSEGGAYVEALNARRVLVDLAHISKRGFADVVAMHDRSLPLVVTHTGVNGAYPCWRNLDDQQLRQIADFGGTVGIIFHSGYLNGRQVGRARADDVVNHIQHVIRVVGADHVSIGSDYDGFIVPPRDLKTCVQLPRLVQAMLDRGLAPSSIEKVLGGNFLRVLRDLRGAG